MRKRVIVPILLLLSLILLLSLRRFKVVKGLHISTQGISEGFTVEKRNVSNNYCITLNVSADNIDSTLFALLSLFEGDCFFHYELQSEKFLPSDEFSKKSIYYIDKLSKKVSHSIVQTYADVLYQDGLVNFGIGSIEQSDEIYVGPYKTFYIYAHEPTQYTEKLRELGFKYKKKMKTLQDNVEDESPFIKVDELPFDRYDLIDSLIPKGLYLSENRIVS